MRKFGGAATSSLASSTPEHIGFTSLRSFSAPSGRPINTSFEGGEEIAGLWSNNRNLVEELKNASESSGEQIWEMPMQNSYKEGLKSMLADLKNTGPRAGGSITAALFLREFISGEIPWAHLDIAGTCWSDKDRDINPAGATGFGVRTLVNWVSTK